MTTQNRFTALRHEVNNIAAATKRGTRDFKLFAQLHGSLIHKCHYRQLDYIFCDTMAVVNGQWVITEQNLAYYPSKIRYFIIKTHKHLVTENYKLSIMYTHTYRPIKIGDKVTFDTNKIDAFKAETGSKDKAVQDYQKLVLGGVNQIGIVKEYGLALTTVSYPDGWDLPVPTKYLIVLPEIASNTNTAIVILTSCGNPDYGQYAPISPKVVKACVTFDDAVKHCKAYIQEYNLGGGNWNGGYIYHPDNGIVAYVSYNGRVWQSDGTINLYNPAISDTTKAIIS